jgi:ribosome biogenesis GTPase
MRELGLWQAEESVAETFTDIEELGFACRFSDCRHGAEPGCAVRSAVERGEVDAGRLESFRRLRLEQEKRARPHERVTGLTRQPGPTRRRS